MLLTRENYAKGFLLDEELMGGVAENPAIPGGYIGFVLRHTTGDYLGYEPYPTLEAALTALNEVRRPWKYETSSGCGDCGLGAQGKCNGGSCGIKRAREDGLVQPC